VLQLCHCPSWSLAGDIESFQLGFFLVHLVSLFCLLCYLVTQCTAPRRIKAFFPGSIYGPLIMNTEIFSISYERNLYPGWLLVQSCYSTSFVRHICIVSSWEPPISSFWDFLLLHFSSGRWDVRSGDQNDICQGTQVRGVHLHLAFFNTESGRSQFLMWPNTWTCKQMHKWKKWEEETCQESFDCAKEGMSG
jgi:hypothetical protein